MPESAQRRRLRLKDALLFGAGVAVPIALWAAGVDTPIFVLTVVLTAGVWTVAWMDLGFLPGAFLFWSAMIVVTQASIEPGDVDNFLPGLAVPFGWVPYLVVFGPLFLLLKLIRSLFKPSPGLGLEGTEGSNRQGEAAQSQQS